MWPSEVTLLVLLLGATPLVYVVSHLIRKDIREVVSLRFLGVVLLWFGYQLSPWLAYLDRDVWFSLLLVPEHIDSGLFFSMICMWAMLIGYRLGNRQSTKSKHSRGAAFVSVPRVTVGWLIALVTVSLALFVVSVGGLDEVWMSSETRGATQWDERDARGKVRQMLSVVGTVADILLASAASLYIAHGMARGKSYVLGWLALIVASLHGVWFFSRAAGLPFIVNAILILRLMPHRRSLVIAVLSLGLALSMGTVGFLGRGFDNPGLASYGRAVVSLSMAIGDIKVRSASNIAALNPLDAMAPWTLRAESTQWDSTIGRGEKISAFFWNLHPLPSELVPLVTSATDLAEIMGTMGSAGLTTPALGELYFVFGFGGAVCFVLLGMIYGWGDKIAWAKPSFASLTMLVLFLSSFAIGLHSSVRAMTRPILYGVVLLFLVTRLVRNLRSRTPRSSETRGPGASDA